GLPQNIIGIERTENIEELVNFYSESDVFLNLTLEDTYPTTNLESVACGTPVITYDTGGSTESVDPKTGFIVEKRDFSALRRLIDKVKKKGKNSYRLCCRQKAIAEFNENDRFKDYIQLYKSLIR